MSCVGVELGTFRTIVKRTIIMPRAESIYELFYCFYLYFTPFLSDLNICTVSSTISPLNYKKSNGVHRCIFGDEYFIGWKREKWCGSGRSVCLDGYLDELNGASRRRTTVFRHHCRSPFGTSTRRFLEWDLNCVMNPGLHFAQQKKFAHGWRLKHAHLDRFSSSPIYFYKLIEELSATIRKILKGWEQGCKFYDFGFWFFRFLRHFLKKSREKINFFPSKPGWEI